MTNGPDRLSEPNPERERNKRAYEMLRGLVDGHLGKLSDDGRARVSQLTFAFHRDEANFQGLNVIEITDSGFNVELLDGSGGTSAEFIMTADGRMDMLAVGMSREAQSFDNALPGSELGRDLVNNLDYYTEVLAHARVTATLELTHPPRT